MRRYIWILILAVFTGAAGICEAVRASEPAVEESSAPAQGAEEEKTEEELAEEAREKEMEEVYRMTVQTNQLKDWPEGPGTYGDAAIVMEAGSGAVLYAKNMEKAEFPASITKILTALLAYRYGDMDADVTITPEAMDCLGSGYASIGMKEGNVISMKQAMYAMLLASSNEVAYAVGETVAASQGQDYDWFVRQMNQVCAELGGVNSNFVNTNGVHDEDHFTCAWDMALIGRELFQYPEFLEICQTPQYVIEESPTTEEHVFQQKHGMLLMNDKDYYEYAVGGKTGYTTEAQNTLVTLADNGQMQLVCVVFKTYGGHVYSDTRGLLDYGFGNFEKVSVENRGSDKIEEMPQGAYVVLPKGMDADVLEERLTPSEGSKELAAASYFYENMPVGRVENVRIFDSAGGEKTDGEDLAFGERSEETKRGKNGRKAFWAILISAAAILLVLTVQIRRARRRRKKQMRRRRKKRIDS